MQRGQTLKRSLTSVWLWLIEPATSLQEVELRHKSRLLAIFLLLMTAIFTSLDITRSLLTPAYTPPWYGYIFLGTAYLLNRTQYYKLAAALTLAMFPLVVFSGVLRQTTHTPTLLLNYLILSLMLSSILLSI